MGFQMKAKFFIVMVLAAIALCLSPVGALGISNAMLNTTAHAGDTIVFTMNAFPSASWESNTTLVVTVEGTISQWITLDKTEVLLLPFTTDGYYHFSPETATIRVPLRTPPGIYTGRVLFSAPKTGMISMAIAVPIKIYVVAQEKKNSCNSVNNSSRCRVEI